MTSVPADPRGDPLPSPTRPALGYGARQPPTFDAAAGGLTAALLSERVWLLLFSTLMLLTAGPLMTGGEEGEREPADPSRPAAGNETPGRLAGASTSPRTGELVCYQAGHLPAGLAVSFVAGNVSGRLGVGGGFLKVPARRLGMGGPRG